MVTPEEQARLNAVALIKAQKEEESKNLGLGCLTLLIVFFLLWLFFGSGCFGHHQDSTPTAASDATAPAPVAAPDPAKDAQDERFAAEVEARQLVLGMLKDPASADFGDITGYAPHVACGSVNAKNAFGGFAGQTRFVYHIDDVSLDDGGGKFGKLWTKWCVERASGAMPTGVLGHALGSHPTPDLKPISDPSDEKIQIFVPVVPVASFEAVPVKSADFGYDHGRLFFAEITVTGEANRQALKDVLIKTYGPPSSMGDQVKYLKWNWPDAKVSMRVDFDSDKPEATARWADDSDSRK